MGDQKPDAGGADAVAQMLAAEIRRRREQAGLSHNDLAVTIQYSRDYVGRAERPRKGLPSAALVAALDDALNADGALVDLHNQALAQRLTSRRVPRTTLEHADRVSTRVDEQSYRIDESRAVVDMTAKGSLAFSAEVNRRAFLAGVAAASVGAAVPEPMARLLDGLGTEPPRRVGMSDVEAVEAAADAYMSFDLARSGEMAAAIARSSLQWSTQLLAQEMAESTRERLSSAVALLADRLGWSTYDFGNSGRAGSLLTFALNHAARGADRNLRAHVMLDLSTVATDAGRPGDGVEILRAALGDERISVAEKANLHAVCARHCASAGQEVSGFRHVVLAEEALGQNDTATIPGWAREITYGPGHHDSALGLALFALGDVDGARQRLTAAVEALDSGRTRTGLRCRIRLAVLSLREGEKDVGETEGYRVISDAAGVSSARIRRDLQMLGSQATRYGSPDLAADTSRLLVSQSGRTTG